VVISGNSKLSIPTFIPLAEAARKYNLTEDVLTRLIQDGRIDAAQLPSGELLVSDESPNEKTKEQIIEEKFEHLQGQRISIYAAAKKYKLSHSTLRGWIKAGYITKIAQQVGDRSLTLIEESEVAYCAFIYHKRKAAGDLPTGTRIFDEDGNPYQLKHPDLALKRRKS
jgi:predicted site-specific integrase-resolvase